MEDLGGCEEDHWQGYRSEPKEGYLWLTQKSSQEKISYLFGIENAEVVNNPLGNHFRFSIT